jgi:hypothetical protein
VNKVTQFWNPATKAYGIVRMVHGDKAYTERQIKEATDSRNLAADVSRMRTMLGCKITMRGTRYVRCTNDACGFRSAAPTQMALPQPKDEEQRLTQMFEAALAEWLRSQNQFFTVMGECIAYLGRDR